MSFRFTVLASGSAGNASILEAGTYGLLLDAGLGPRQLAQRFASVGFSWPQVCALILTHTHSDHWNDRTLAQLLRRQIPLYCHSEHYKHLQTYSATFAALVAAGLVRTYTAEAELSLAPGLRCQPLPVRHDCITFGFRFEGAPDLFGQAYSLAYLADLGCWDTALAEALINVDLLALEFNHDVDMECHSGRMPQLISRVLGDDGHLSNLQAAALLKEVLRRSAPGRLRHIVQLHLSRECNCPHLATETVQTLLTELGHSAEIHTARQDEPGPTIHLGSTANGRQRRQPARRPRSSPTLPKARSTQSWLPGLEPA